MAKQITTIPSSGLMPLDRSVKRLNAQPDHPDLYFTSLGTASDTGTDTAMGFAKNSALACVGDILTVASGSSTKLYLILNVAGDLAEIFSSDNLDVNALISAQLASYIPNIGFQGDLPTASTAVKKGQEFRAGRRLVGTSTTVEANDYLIAKVDHTLPAASSLTTSAAIEAALTKFVVVEQNLTGALVGITDAVNNARTFTSGKYISKVEIDSDGKLKFTESDLPVKSVTVSGSGNVITGAEFSGGALTLTKGDFPVAQRYLLHSLVFTGEEASAGADGIQYGAISKGDDESLFVALSEHPWYADPVDDITTFGNSLIVTVNGIRMNYREDYTVDAGKVIFSANSYVEQSDLVSVTYMTDPTNAETQNL